MLQISVRFWRARSRLYRNNFLQVNTTSGMHFAAFFNIYNVCTLVHRSKLSILAKYFFENSAAAIIFREIS